MCYVCELSYLGMYDVNVAQRRQDKTLSMRPMGEGLDVKFGEFGIYLPHTFRRREKEVFGTHSLYRVRTWIDR